MSEEIAVIEPVLTGKTFSEDYVHSLREENKENRLARKAAEEKAKQLKESSDAFKSKFGNLFGLADGEELDEGKVAKFTQSIISKADSKLILAEVKSLDGYDTKLVERLLDRSKVKIADDGTVTGLKEAVEALALEFPSIKIQPKGNSVNPPPAVSKTALDEYNEALKAAYANPRDNTLQQRLFILKEKLKGD